MISGEIARRAAADEHVLVAVAEVYLGPVGKRADGWIVGQRAAGRGLVASALRTDPAGARRAVGDRRCRRRRPACRRRRCRPARPPAPGGARTRTSLPSPQRVPHVALVEDDLDVLAARRVHQLGARSAVERQRRMNPDVRQPSGSAPGPRRARRNWRHRRRPGSRSAWLRTRSSTSSASRCCNRTPQRRSAPHRSVAVQATAVASAGVIAQQTLAALCAAPRQVAACAGAGSEAAACGPPNVRAASDAASASTRRAATGARDRRG